MNSSRPEALPVTWDWHRSLLYVALMLGAAPVFGDVHEADPRGFETGTSGKIPASIFAATRKAVRKDTTVQSDVVPSPDQHQAAPKDMLLSPEDERKADALASFIDGSIAEDNADVDRALDDYRKVLAVDPAAKIRADDDSDTQTLLAAKVAVELARRGDPASGIDLLKDTAKAAPGEPTTYYFLAQLYSKFLRKYDVALKYADQALNLDPNNFIFYVTNYELQLNLGQAKKAVDILDRAAKMQNNDPEFWMKLSELYIHAMVKDDGTSGPADLKKMNALFQKTLSLSKGDPMVAAKVGDFYVLTKQIKDAIPLYETALKAKGKSSDPMVTNVREKLASSYIATGQADAAIATLEDLIKHDPMRSGSYEMLGQLYAAKGDLEKALNNYQQTLLLSPNQPLNYLRVSDMMFQLKKYEKAVDLLRETRKKFPDLPRITYALAQALSLAKKHGEAVAVFQEAQGEAQNSESEMLDGNFYFDFGAAAEQAGNVQKAAELFKKSIDLDPANAAKAYNYLGFMWVDRGQNLDEAGNLIKRAVEMEPDNGAYIDSLGWYYYKKGDCEKALAELLKAAGAIKPEDAVVFDHIGDTYQKMGNVSQATSYWQKAVTLDPDNKQIADKLESAKQKVTTAPSPLPPKKDGH